jgi:ABC-2 type transport system permease protein
MTSISWRWPARARALWRFGAALFVTSLRASIATRGAFIAQALFMAINNVVFFVFWWVLLRRVPHIRGWQLADVEVLYGLTAATCGIVVVVTGGVRYLGACIEEGELDTLLTQPKPALLYALGLRSRASGFGDLATGLVLLGLSGQVTLATMPLVVAAVLAGAMAVLGAGIVFFSLPFWMARTETLSRQLWELAITFSLYPEPLFGGALRLLLVCGAPHGAAGQRRPVRDWRRPVRGWRSSSRAEAAGLRSATAAARPPRRSGRRSPPRRTPPARRRPR